MKILVCDTETTGLPLDWGKPSSDVDNWPRICEMAFELFDEYGNTIRKEIYLILPNGWTIPDKKYFISKGHSEPEAVKAAKFWIDNGFDTETSLKYGVPIEQVLKVFASLYDECDLMVCHNISFDKNVISAELIRAKIKVKGKKPDFCTKLEGELICKIPSQYPGKFKWPKLDELYRHLFGKDFEGAHAAGNDIQATKECYLEIMLRREYESI